MIQHKEDKNKKLSEVQKELDDLKKNYNLLTLQHNKLEKEHKSLQRDYREIKELYADAENENRELRERSANRNRGYRLKTSDGLFDMSDHLSTMFKSHMISSEKAYDFIKDNYLISGINIF